ncbi:UDP-N-acetylmuramoyl-L-alanyl-D-glutamate--2,6-diaminopimelate ligase [Streptomyces tubbatahanensis]|uniref:UDP-N-acetylmuramyl-tripeptide synthetase n=1 Tax=Streptomyces tubbatahanensis TaxID=2923272 RepID=A0ABY3XLA1_9ACTN|nr:UDP-N-acetylmuramoyl-L-alanyl-D-glutamate--2,6-diaminopimelate ligase [Streptomyces tubbatahanensis]UNS95179.1 UDP-N-acetylmuramoyl-L-alanyl-D-glutamate--2,6-diaminopimelate ligase [Streptomyces tubbatahanensis]
MTSTSRRADRPGAVPMSLDAILHALRALAPEARLIGPPASGRTGVHGVTLDSGDVEPGDLFAGLPGTLRHGADHAEEAAAAGAVALLSDRTVGCLPTLVVDQPRRALGFLASRLYGDPSRALSVYGVTGTNGKTSTAHLLAAGLEAAGRRVGLAGSLETRVPGRARRPAVRTTAEAPVIQRLLAGTRQEGGTDAVLEVSSHALALSRVNGTRFRVAVFTNLSPDHLDLHGDLEHYYAAKASLFTPDRCAHAVVNIGDAHGRRLAAETRCPLTTFTSGPEPADWSACDIHADVGGTRFRLRGPGVDREVRLLLLGPHQADNMVAAAAALAAGGADVTAALRGMEHLASIPGRLERVDVGQGFLAFVDFAHNTGGQHRLLPFLRSLTSGRVIVVLGATGERDPAKRAALGDTAARDADLLIVTDESAHGEDPAMLRTAVANGARRSGQAEVHVEPDRRHAFSLAVSAARPGDVLVVAGRGADQEQTSTRGSRPFDDRVALHAALLQHAAAHHAREQPPRQALLGTSTPSTRDDGDPRPTVEDPA